MHRAEGEWGRAFPPNAEIYTEPQINFIIFSSLIMPTSAARPKLCTCILIHPFPPPVSLGIELFSNYRREKGSVPREGEAKAGGGQEVRAARGRQEPCPLRGLLAGPGHSELLAAVEDLPS